MLVCFSCTLANIICCGSIISAAANLVSRGVNVAENINVCSRCSHASAIALISSEKPKSSMRSASSNTKVCNCDRLIPPCCTQSSKRPGVATTNCAPFKPCFCLKYEVPPTMVATRIPRVFLTKLIASDDTCCANSRVGHNTKVMGAFDGLFLPEPIAFTICCNAGNKNAAVLPLPVCEATIQSPPCNAAGTKAACTGVGWV